MSLINETLTLPAGQTENQCYTFCSNWDIPQANLHIIKNETTERVYNLAIRYSSRDNNERPVWGIKLDGKSLKNSVDNSKLWYHGSTKIVLTPVENNTIQIDETDEHQTGTILVDCSKLPYTVSKTSLLLDKTIQENKK